jgi:serine/threonine protein kinase/Tol biopolymer transport system component
MALEPGARLGPYEVLAPLGEGADERYKASDTRKSQVVALKVLPPEFSAHPEMKARLESDSHTISSLNHPQISAIVEVGHQDPATDFVVMEFVDGETLAQRLVRGRLELRDALSVAIAIADSLDKAHRRHVVHGGLNPSVVVLTPTGPKLLDFGVARIAQDVGAFASGTMITTRTSLASLSAVPTFAAPYLAPEQFVAAATDARSDIFSFGAILYEMVTARKAFDEKTLALLIAAVQTVDPEPVSKIRPETPPALEYVITRCLNKDPKQRFQSAFDVLSELQWVTQGSAKQIAAAPAAAHKYRNRTTWIGAAVASVLALALVPSTLARFARASEPDEVRFIASSLPQGTAPVTVSPDGRWVTATINGGSLMGLSLDSVTPQVLVNEPPYQPFWSPDSRSIAYFDAGGTLKRVDIGGGPPQIISDTQRGFAAGTWNKDGIILFPSSGVIQRVLAAGGQPAPVTALDASKRETEHIGPVFLPDGRHFLFLAVSSQPGESAVYAGSLDSPARTRLFVSESIAAYAAPGYLLFNRGDTVFAQAFNADKLSLSGEPIRVASGVPLRIQGNGSSSVTRSANFAVSQTGVLAYRTGAVSAVAATAEEQRRLFWFDRTGQRAASVGTPAGYVGVDLSPDGKRVAVHRHESTGGDSWIFDLAQDRLQRLTFDATQENGSPIWSPDGTRVAFSSNRNGKVGLYVKLADGAATEELIVESNDQKVPMSWSPDGKLLVYDQNTGAGDIWAVAVSGDKKPFPIVQSPATETSPQVSPDGKWMAYQSNETRQRPEVYVKPFPSGPGKWQVSVDGGQFPRWRHDGKELYFYFNNTMFAADIRVAGSSFEAGAPRSLFGLPSPNAATNHPPYHRYAVSADGQRFLISQGGGVLGAAGGLSANVASQADGGGSNTSGNPVTVVLNWTRMLKQK